MPNKELDTTKPLEFDEEIFLIYEGWIDPMENDNADGYEAIGFVTNESMAKKICNDGGHYTGKDCWSVRFYPNEKMPKFKYKKIKIFRD
jgi:hypothetical protein